MLVSLMVRVMVRLPGRVRAGGYGFGRFREARPGTGAGRAASRGAGRRRSRTPGGGAAGSRRGTAGRTVRPFRPGLCPRAGGLGSGAWRPGDGARLVSGGGGSLAGLSVGCMAGLAGGQAGAAGFGLVAVSSPGGFGFLQDLCSQMVILLGALQAGLAGQAGLVRAVGAGLGAIALVLGGLVQGGQDRADVPAGEGDGRRGRDLDQVGAGRVVLGAFPDPGQVADEADGAADVLVVAAEVAVLLERVQDVGDEAEAGPAVAGHRRAFL